MKKVALFIAGLLLITAESNGCSDVSRGIQAAPITQSNTEPRVDLVQKKIIYGGERPYSEELELGNIPDLTPLDIPFRSGAFEIVALECAGFEQDGHLRDCEILASDNDPAYKAVGQLLARSLRARPDAVASQSPIKSVYLQARISNSDMPATNGPCWPPLCIGVPPPPDFDGSRND